MTSESFCILPWIHMYVSPDGTAQPCCINRPETSIVYGNVNEDSWEKMWNSETIRQFRLDLLAGKKRPDVCAGCYQSEEHGLLSHRQRNNQKYADLVRDLVPETAGDGSVGKLRMYYWDFRFSNLCNLKCRSCGPLYSSRWKDDVAKAGFLKPKLVADLERTRSKDYRDFMTEQIHHVRDIYFAGGEPLLSPEHYHVLEELIRNGKTDVGLTYSSNSTCLEFRGKRVIDYWQKFKSVNFMVSVDDIHRRAGFLRSGTDWAELVANVKSIRREAPHVRMTAVVTVSIFNTLHLREIHQALIENEFLPQGAPLDVVINVVGAPGYLRPGVLPARLRRKAIGRLKEYQSELSTRYGQPVSLFEPVISALNEDHSDKITEFVCMTRRWDRIRRESVSEFYPELNDVRFWGEVLAIWLRRKLKRFNFKNAVRDSWINFSVRSSVALPFPLLPAGKRKFSTDLISHHLPIWKGHLEAYRGKPNLTYLEVGVLEGQSLLWMLEHVLTHPTSRATAVDPLKGAYYPALRRNLVTAKKPSKIRFVPGRSQQALPQLTKSSYDIIYVDGSHEPEDLALDLKNSWPLLKPGGTLILDDYEWGEREGVPPARRPKPVIDAFLATCAGKVVEKGWQVVVTKP